VLDFLSTTDVGRLGPAQEGVGSETGVGMGAPGAPEAKRGRRRRRRLPVVGGGGGPLFLPTPSFMASADEE